MRGETRKNVVALDERGYGPFSGGGDTIEKSSLRDRGPTRS
jgi:hypothetical protein